MRKVIAEIKKTKKEIVRVELSEFQETDCINIRVWKKSGRDNLLPTTRGISMAVWRLPELLAALTEAEKEARAAGLLDNITHEERQARKQVERVAVDQSKSLDEKLGGTVQNDDLGDLLMAG